jgi:hypothetical protein
MGHYRRWQDCLLIRSRRALQRHIDAPGQPEANAAEPQGSFGFSGVSSCGALASLVADADGRWRVRRSSPKRRTFGIQRASPGMRGSVADTPITPKMNADLTDDLGSPAP